MASVSAAPRPALERASSPALAVSLEGVSVRFTNERGTVTALENIDLELPAGGFLSLLGPSGCGKSTLLRVVSDLVQPTTGRVQVLGGDASEARKRREIGFVFQDAALLPWRTVLQNVELPLEVRAGRNRQGSRSARELLSLLGLEGWENAFPHELSGGMRQRVSIARALVTDPKLLLMDEPFAALDEITRDRLNEELLRIWQATGTTVIFVTHSIYEAAFLSQQVVVLAARPGRIRERVDVELASPRAIAMRETPAFVAIAARLRQILETC